VPRSHIPTWSREPALVAAGLATQPIVELANFIKLDLVNAMLLAIQSIEDDCAFHTCAPLAHRHEDCNTIVPDGLTCCLTAAVCRGPDTFPITLRADETQMDGGAARWPADE
jgi:hypothetical protein